MQSQNVASVTASRHATLNRIVELPRFRAAHAGTLRSVNKRRKTTNNA